MLPTLLKGDKPPKLTPALRASLKSYFLHLQKQLEEHLARCGKIMYDEEHNGNAAAPKIERQKREQRRRYDAFIWRLSEELERELELEAAKVAEPAWHLQGDNAMMCGGVFYSHQPNRDSKL